MRLRLIVAVLVAGWGLAGNAFAQEQAAANRATELKDRPAADAKTLAPLAAEAKVRVLGREGAWTQVEVEGRQGWVRSFHLRFSATVATQSSGNALGGLAAMVGIGRKGPETAKSASLGIRGLTPEDFRNASPDPAALARMQSFRADKAEAERFAQQARLSAVRIAYPPEGS